jgi:hypothetical protein
MKGSLGGCQLEGKGSWPNHKRYRRGNYLRTEIKSEAGGSAMLFWWMLRMPGVLDALKVIRGGKYFREGSRISSPLAIA